MTIIRSGIKKIRVIDYDIVTLSSLNRHAFAVRKDVGKLKVRVVKEYLEQINPNIELECIDDAFIKEDADDYIKKGNPDYVIDCIDDLEAKCDLINYCHMNKISIISSMGAAGRMDPTCIRLGDLATVQGDILAKRIKYIYKKSFKEKIPEIPIIYSIEKNSMTLCELEENQKDNPELHRVNENERVRSLPVFASIPAIFGQALASYVLCEISGKNQ
jgi:tRNA A37 threonylcarbamoyladenosine dehydratase